MCTFESRKWAFPLKTVCYSFLIVCWCLHNKLSCIQSQTLFEWQKTFKRKRAKEKPTGCSSQMVTYHMETLCIHNLCDDRILLLLFISTIFWNHKIALNWSASGFRVLATQTIQTYMHECSTMRPTQQSHASKYIPAAFDSMGLARRVSGNLIKLIEYAYSTIFV